MGFNLSSLSVLGRMTTAVTPKSQGTKHHLVVKGEDILGIANQEYGNTRYDPKGWRRILDANEIENPFALDDLAGTYIIIPPAPVADSFS